jgi:acetyl-CoA carboxylase carboxyl transferase subunit beta
MAWFNRKRAGILTDRDERNEAPDGLWVKCPSCEEMIYRRELEAHHFACTQCGHHFRLSNPRYLDILFDDSEYELHDQELRSVDALEFSDRKSYADRLEDAQEKTGQPEAVLTATGTVGGHEVALAAMDFSFIGGSMGSVVGEKIARIARRALERPAPLLIVSASGGARMMEGVLSLMQMAKTASVLGRLQDEGVPYISILTDPTTGGVTASYAMLGDVNLAEPGALIGFAGPRVIEETIRQELPEGFQKAEFLLEHGMVDRVVDRRQMRETVAKLLRHMWAGWSSRE